MKYLNCLLIASILFVVSVNAQNDTPIQPISSTTSEQRAEQQTDRYRIGFQDTVEVQVFGQPQLAQRVKVNSNGTINLFRLPDPILAVCKTERELANDIAEAYKRDYLRNPEVNVVTVEQFSQSFAIVGEVDKPANYFISRRIRLLELLAYAGGPTKDAGSRVIVARQGSAANCRPQTQGSEANEETTAFSFALRDVLENKVDLVMQPGDVVSVLKADVVFVYGNVNKQGPVTMAEPITLLQALSSAEGLKPATKKDSVRIIRMKPGSAEPDEFVISLSDIEKRKARDPYLQPNDIIAVSEDMTKSILNAIGKSLTQGVGSVFYRVGP